MKHIFPVLAVLLPAAAGAQETASPSSVPDPTYGHCMALSREAMRAEQERLREQVNTMGDTGLPAEIKPQKTIDPASITVEIDPFGKAPGKPKVQVPGEVVLDKPGEETEADACQRLYGITP